MSEIQTRCTGISQYEKKEGIVFNKDNPKSVSRVQKHFKDEADINKIIEKYRRTGVLVDPLRVNGRKPMFGDFTDVKDYQTVKNRFLEVELMFSKLKASVRAKFNNSVSRFISFMSDANNLEEARKLGIVDPDLSKVKYVDKDGTDVTETVKAEQGLKVKGEKVVV